MDSKAEGGFLTLVVLGVIAFFVLRTGVLYQTGSQWFTACWQAQHATEPAKTPEEAIARNSCGHTAEAALYDAGYIFAGNPEYAKTPELHAVQQACPNAYSEVPLMGIQILLVDDLEAHGGTDLLDSVLPAGTTIKRVLKKRWPNCAAVREAAGFPKVIEKNGGFHFADDCKPCEAEQAAKVQRYGN